MLRALTLILTIFCLAIPAMAMDFDEVIKKPQPHRKYFFYMHGALIEEQGVNATSPRYGRYEYENIVEEFTERKITVISEVRPKVSPIRYSDTIAMQVRRLIAGGVPSPNITVGGHSKGGLITLLVASKLGDPYVNYVVMAGCGRGKVGRMYKQFLQRKRGKRLQGRMLSIYDRSDLIAGTCKEAAAQAAQGGMGGFHFQEIDLNTRKGHGLFYSPLNAWVMPVTSFIKGR